MNKILKFRIISILCTSLLGYSTFSSAQINGTQLDYTTYIQQILQQHPIAQQADLANDKIAAQNLAARGYLDPNINAEWSQKNFDDKLYYQVFDAQIQVPTRMGIDIVGGYEYANGDFLDPQNKTDQYGLLHLGIEANLLQGLWVNERRMAVEQAEIYARMTRNQQQILLNELLYAATLAYLDWQKYDRFSVIFLENIDLARIYFSNTKQSYQNGEKAAIDTLEAQIILQDATLLLQQNEAQLTKARFMVENFLWYENKPIALRPSTHPQADELPITNQGSDFNPIQFVDNQPILQEKNNKIALKETELRLKQEKLKPKLKAKYNPLLATADEGRAINYTPAEATWGVAFSMPIQRRSERAAVQQTEIALQESALDLNNKRNELLNKAENNRAQIAIIDQQITAQTQNVENYKRLLEAENEKFRFGESSVFLINKRQEKYINGRLKRIDLGIKREVLELEYRYLFGVIFE